MPRVGITTFQCSFLLIFRISNSSFCPQVTAKHVSSNNLGFFKEITTLSWDTQNIHKSPLIFSSGDWKECVPHQTRQSCSLCLAEPWCIHLLSPHGAEVLINSVDSGEGTLPQDPQRPCWAQKSPLLFIWRCHSRAVRIWILQAPNKIIRHWFLKYVFPFPLKIQNVFDLRVNKTNT